jgi:sortase (surface protein transpeptidase)
MPTAPRPARSLLALALVVNLIAASAPTPAFGSQLAGDELVPEAPAARVATPADGPDRAAAARARVETTTASRPLVASVPAGWTSRPRTSVPEPKPTAVAKASARDTARTGAMRGRNHVWIPALGINKSVSGYACSSSYYPGNRVYRWGCAGSNNVYLFGHAHSVFKPLHDAYVRGKLRKGMKVYYAGGDGNVSTYAVSWWRLTTPEKGSWAFAGQSRPSLTLQTCVGARSQYRLIVRLARV